VCSSISIVQRVILTAVSAPVERFVDDSGDIAVRGTLHRPALPGVDVLVLTHGAGSNHDAPVLRAVAEAFAARGTTVLRCDLPFRQARSKGPPAPAGAARDRAGLRRAVELMRARCPGRVLLGGASYGGRQATLLVAEHPRLVDGLLLLAYPLHAPGRADAPRAAHFPRIRTPALFVHGTRDPFGTIAELEAARATLGGASALIAVADVGHDLGRGRTPFAERVPQRLVALIESP
jgi:predicted alpha/beta-hydrolase family hydrolase